MSGPKYSLYQRVPGLVLGFHGCDEELGEDLLCGRKPQLIASENTYDWLGAGIYFWENDPQRALEFAQDAHAKPKLSKGHIAKPFVVGAVLDLGLCLNLLERPALAELAEAYEVLQATHTQASEPLPRNVGENLGARFLDRAVVQTLHTYRAALDGVAGGFPAYDSVRAAFPEGDELYTGAGFRAKNHVQIAICNPRCIRGYFRPIPDL